jgi:uncharacterized protein YndB with AHSA1/START domain
MAKPIHVYQTYVRAPAAEVWRAITDPDFTKRYFHAQRFESALEPGSPYRFVAPDGSDSVVGVIEEVDPPRRLVMTWRVLYDAAAAAEPPSRVEWELDDRGDGVTRVTTVHRDLGASPRTSEGVAGGWLWVLHSLKSLLETGDGLPRFSGEEPAAELADGDEHRRLAVEANGSAWELLGRDSALAPDEADDLLARAYAAAHHWRLASGAGPAQAARASWLVSRVHAVLGHGDLALHHADRCAATVEAAGLADFDLAYALEARARALACLGRDGEASQAREAARRVPIADAEDRSLFESDLAAGPWYGLDGPAPAPVPEVAAQR